MSTVRIDRFTADPAVVEELLANREALVAAVRRAVPGLTEARLTRVDDRTWLDMWHWDSREQALAAVDLAHSGGLPEAAKAFALTSDATTEFVEVVDVR